MPQGPGEDILDAIEGGKGDDVILKQFKINGDQLRAFKSLHYGLSNQKMAFSEINDYYPELADYFKASKGPAMAPPTQAPTTGSTAPVQPDIAQARPEPEPDIFKLVKERSRLGKELAASQDLSRNAKSYMGASVLANDEEALNKRKTQISEIDERLKKAGYEPDDIIKALGDLPDIPGIDPKQAMQLKQDNPQQFDRYKAAINSQYGLLHAIEKKDGAKAANDYLKQYQELQKSPDYASQRVATKNAIGAVYKYVDNADEQRRLIKDMVRDKSFGYGIGLPGHEEAIYNDPRSQNLNPYQVTALQFLEDVDPAKAESYNRLLAFTPEEVGQLEKYSSFARGYEAKSRDLENMGMNLMRNSLEEQMHGMIKTREQWTEEDKQKYNEVFERYKTLNEDFKGQGKRYPAMATMDADRQMQDAMGTSSKGVAEQTILGIGENVDDALNWVGSLIQSPFQTHKESALDDLQLLGDKRLSQLGQYETEGQELFGRDFKTVFTGDLKKQIDEIKSNAALSDDEQRDSIKKAILDDNRANVIFLPNDQAGKMNFTAKAVLNTVSNVASEIVPQIALAYITGGGAGASKIQELTSLFSTTFATAYNDIYNEAIEKDIPNPSQYALVHTTIEASTELIFNDLNRVKKMFGGKLTGKLLENVTEEEMKLLSKTGRFARLKEVLKSTGKTALRSSSQESFEEVAGQLGGNIVDKKLFNQEVNVTDDVLQTGVTTFLGMLPLAGLGLPFKYKEISQMQKYALYEAGMNPDKFLARVEDDLKNGTITPSEAQARKNTIEKTAKIAQAMNAVRSDGSVLTDNEKTELLTNEVVADSVKEKKKNAPEETKEKLEKVEETLDKEKEKLLKPKKNASKTKAKTKAEANGGIAESPAEQKSPAEEGAVVNTTVGEPAAPVGEMRYTNPEGTEYVLRGDALFHVNKKGDEIAFSEKAMQAQGTKALVEMIKESNTNVPNVDEVGLPPGTKEVDIKTEEDFEREINRVMQERKPGFDEMAGPVNNPASENSFDDYYKKAQGVIKGLFPGLKVTVYQNSAEYQAGEGRPAGSLGNYDPVNKTVAFNLELINQHGRQRNVFHEIIHPIVEQAIGANHEHLTELYDSIEELKDIPGLEEVWNHMNQYYNRGGKIQKIEAITQFLTLVADGKIDTSSMSEKAITKIIDILNKILAALNIDKQISTASDIKRLADSVVLAFQEQNIDPLKATLGNRQGVAAGTESLDALTSQDQEDAIKALIKKTPASVTDDKLNAILVKAAGITAVEAQALIDEVRKPVVPPGPVIPTAQLSPASRQASINKIDKVFDKPVEKKPNWFQRQIGSLRNASAWIENPYRFITKITRDINKEYGLANREQIPLGRQFEKSAAGRAALRVQAFVSEVINGNIGNQKLGRLRGEKYQDFQKYLFNRRVIDRLDKQHEKQLAGEESNRQTGNVTRQDAEVYLEKLANKYGDLSDFEARAEALQQHMGTMLKNLVASGILSKQAYDDIKADNDFYAPFSVVQAKLLADQKTQTVGISGVIKRIKGIEYKTLKTKGDVLSIINALGGALNEKIISPEEYFNTSREILDDAKNQGLITEEQYDQHLAELETPGFALNDILDAAANMIYKSEGIALKNRMLQRLYAYKAFDTDGLYIQDVEGFTAMTLQNGETRMIPKQLGAIKVNPGMAAIKLRVEGKDKIVAVNEKAAGKLTTISNYETATWLKMADWFNRVFRTFVITLSPGFQVVNFAIDFVRTAMFSRYGPIAGKGLVQPIVNAVLFMPQYIDALLHSAAGNLGLKSKSYKQWMESDSFSKGMFDNLFTNEKKIKEVTAPLAKRVLMNFLKLKFIDVPGSILEQTHKLATYQRGLSVEGFKPEMFTAMLGSLFSNSIQPNMTQSELDAAMDRLNYEVQNFAGSPNFPQTHRWMKLASIFLQFFSARVKGEVTDYRRLANIFTTKGEGVKLSAQERGQLMLQFLGAAGAIAAYAIMNNLDDEDEDEFNKIPPYHQDNYMNIPAGKFEYKMIGEDRKEITVELRDYAKLPLRGLTATMNVVANSAVKFYKRENPEEFKKMAMAFMGNASPINLNGRDERELGESAVSNLTPVFKFFIEYSFNRDTHSHRDIIPDTHGNRSMLSNYRHGNVNPWDVKTDKTPDWAIKFSKFLFDELGMHVNAITIDHMENTMGNPTELYDNAIKKRLWRSQMKYPIYMSKTPPPVKP